MPNRIKILGLISSTERKRKEQKKGHREGGVKEGKGKWDGEKKTKTYSLDYFHPEFHFVFS